MVDERLMKFHGIHQSHGCDIPVASRRKTTSSKGPTKKRKLDKLAQTSEDLNADDDEGLGTVITEPGRDQSRAQANANASNLATASSGPRIMMQ